MFDRLDQAIMSDKDDIVEMNKNNIVFLAHKIDEPWINTLTNIKNTDVHLLNKRAFIRHADDYIKRMYNEN